MSNPAQENPVASLIAAVNALVGSTLQEGQFLFTPPTRLTDHPSQRNTQITLVPFATSGFYGRVRVYYNRIHVSQLGAIAVERTNELSVRPLVPKINTLKGIFLNADHVQDTALPPKNGNDGKIAITLMIDPLDYVFYGEGVLDAEGDSPMPPIWPAAGTELDSGCHGVTLVGTLANGSGGWTEVVLAENSPFCGYVNETGTTQFVFKAPPSTNTDLVFDEPNNTTP